MQPSVRDRLLGGAGAAIVLAVIGGLLLFGMRVTTQALGKRTEALVMIAAPRPPKPPAEPQARQTRSTKTARRASPRNLRNKATDIVALPPLVVLVPPSIISTPHAGTGMAASTGASDTPGPGEGAGGAGDGTGGGGAGDEDYLAPRRISGRLKIGDVPPEIRAAGIGGTVAVRYRVEADGHVGACAVVASSGNPALDALTCQLIQSRFRFHPSRDPSGRPVSSQVEERHSWDFDTAAAIPPVR